MNRFSQYRIIRKKTTDNFQKFKVLRSFREGGYSENIMNELSKFKNINTIKNEKTSITENVTLANSLNICKLLDTL